MNTRVKILGLLTVIFFAILMLVTSFTQKNHIKYTGEEMLGIVLDSDYMVDSAMLKKLPQYLMIDLREYEETLLNPIAGAINIPLSELLIKENQQIFKRDNPKVFISYDLMIANEAWMLMNQMGYENMYVMEMKKAENKNEAVVTPEGAEKTMGGH